VKNVIFIAPPAAGKGALSDYLISKYGYTHISSGELFRDKINLHSEEGKKIEQILKSGNLVDNKTTFQILKEKLTTLKKEEKFILDGVPRTLQQANNLDIILHDLNFSNYVVIYVQVEEEILKKRMLGRRICKNCKKTYNLHFEKFKPLQKDICDICGEKLINRVDDNEESFQKRYRIFLKNNESILDYYKTKNKLVLLTNNQEQNEDSLKELQRIVGAIVD